MNPEPEEEENHQPLDEDQEGENEEEKGTTDEEEKKEPPRKELGMDGQIIDTAESKAVEAGFTLPGQTQETDNADKEKQGDIDESLKHHRDSASTLGHSSTYQSSPEETSELQTLTAEASEGNKTSQLLVTIDLEEEGCSRGKEGEALDQIDSPGSTLKVEKESSSDGEYHTPPLLPITGSSTEPGLKPINEEPQISDKT